MHIMMTQMNIRESIKQVGERVNAALLKELNQLLSKQVKKVLSKHVIEYEKYTGADTNRFSTARGLELSGESSTVESTE